MALQAVNPDEGARGSALDTMRGMFEILGSIRGIERIAAGSSIRELQRLRKSYGPGRLEEAQGQRPKEFKIKLFWG